MIRRLLTCLSPLALAGGIMGTFGCAADPAPINIYDDHALSVSLAYDPSAGSGHNHPAAVSSEQMTAILQGIGVRMRNSITGFGLFGDKEGGPAFLSAEVTRLVPHLIRGLAKASPQDMATFYLVTRDRERNELVTSGGIFVRDRRVYLILANARASRFGLQYENASPVDTKDKPLLPISRYRFSLFFTPEEAWVPNAAVRGKDGYGGYLDESKLLVIDLDRLPVQASK